MKKILALLGLLLLCVAFVACGDTDGTVPTESSACEHANTNWYTKAPTCTKEGARSGDCPDCGQYISEKLPAKGHEIVDNMCAGCKTYYINNYDEFLAFAQSVNNGNTYSGVKVELLADIDLKNQEWTPIGNDTYSFSGVFNGNNHTISNLLITKNYTYAGLFSRAGGTLKNLNVSGSITTNSFFVGMIAGFASAPSGCSATGYITVTEREDTNNKETSIGGAFGRCGDVNSCYSNVQMEVVRTIHLDICVGGIAGEACWMQGCYSLGDISVAGYGTNIYVGGIVGKAEASSTEVAIIEECFSRGDIVVLASGTYTPRGYVGGILGYSEAFTETEVTACFVLGDIELKGTPNTNDCYAGSIAGKYRSNPVVERCYYSFDHEISAPNTTRLSEQSTSDKTIFTADFQKNTLKLSDKWIIDAKGGYPTLAAFAQK